MRAWCSQRMRELTGSPNDMMIEVIAGMSSIEDVKEVLIANLGRSPAIVAFAEEFVRRKDMESAERAKPRGRRR